MTLEIKCEFYENKCIMIREVKTREKIEFCTDNPELCAIHKKLYKNKLKNMLYDVGEIYCKKNDNS